MAYKLILDDLRNLSEIRSMMNDSFYFGDWIIVRNYKDFCRIIEEKGLPHKISFDHDLADFDKDKEFTGKDCANFVCNYCIQNKKFFPKYRIHSSNPAGRDNIKGLIENFIKLQKSGFFE